jgi:hypothetical protein
MPVSPLHHRLQNANNVTSSVDPTMSSSAPVRRAAETIVRFDPKAKPAQRQAKPEDSLAKPAAVAGWELPKPVPSLHDGLVPVREIGGRKDGTEPTRYGDWEKNGRCIDF